MAVEIKSGAGSDLLTVDPISKAIRVTNYYPDGSIHEHLPKPLTINSVTVVDNDILASFDTVDYQYISLQLSGVWAGTVKFQGSNDNGTFEDIVVQDVGSVLSPYVTEMTTNGGVKIPILFKYIRIRVTSYTSGIVQGTAFGYAQSFNTGQISSVGTMSINSGQTLDTVTNLQQLGGQTVAMGGGAVTSGTQRVTVATDTPVVLGAGTALIGNVKVLPTISAPVIPLKVISAVGVNATLVQAGPTNINFVLIVSTAATPRFVKFYDKATAPIVGTDIPTHTFPLAVGASPIQAPPKGFNFTNGFGYAILLSVDDSGTTPFTVAGEVVLMMEYT